MYWRRASKCCARCIETMYVNRSRSTGGNSRNSAHRISGEVACFAHLQQPPHVAGFQPCHVYAQLSVLCAWSPFFEQDSWAATGSGRATTPGATPPQQPRHGPRQCTVKYAGCRSAGSTPCRCQRVLKLPLWRDPLNGASGPCFQRTTATSSCGCGSPWLKR